MARIRANNASGGGGAQYELQQNVEWAGSSYFTVSTSKKAKGIYVVGTGSLKNVLFCNYYNGEFNPTSIHRYDNNGDMGLTITDNSVTINTQYYNYSVYFDVIVFY